MEPMFRLLIVEQVPDRLEQLLRLALDAGIPQDLISQARTLHEAGDQIDMFDFQLAICDIRPSPGGVPDGSRLIRRILDRNPKCLVICITDCQTADGDKALGESAYAARAFDYLNTQWLGFQWKLVLAHKLPIFLREAARRQLPAVDTW